MFIVIELKIRSIRVTFLLINSMVNQNNIISTSHFPVSPLSETWNPSTCHTTNCIKSLLSCRDLLSIWFWSETTLTGSQATCSPTWTRASSTCTYHSTSWTAMGSTAHPSSGRTTRWSNCSSTTTSWLSYPRESARWGRCTSSDWTTTESGKPETKPALFYGQRWQGVIFFLGEEMRFTDSHWFLTVAVVLLLELRLRFWTQSQVPHPVRIFVLINHLHVWARKSRTL